MGSLRKVKKKINTVKGTLQNITKTFEIIGNEN